ADRAVSAPGADTNPTRKRGMLPYASGTLLFVTHPRNQLLRARRLRQVVKPRPVSPRQDSSMVDGSGVLEVPPPPPLPPPPLPPPPPSPPPPLATPLTEIEPPRL